MTWRAWSAGRIDASIRQFVSADPRSSPSEPVQMPAGSGFPASFPHLRKNTMKFTLGAIALALAAPAAFAQSSVTIYGIVDLDGQYLSGHAKQVLRHLRRPVRQPHRLQGHRRPRLRLLRRLRARRRPQRRHRRLRPGRRAVRPPGLRRPAHAVRYRQRRPPVQQHLHADRRLQRVHQRQRSAPTTAVIGGFAGGYEPVRGGANDADDLDGHRRRSQRRPGPREQLVPLHDAVVRRLQGQLPVRRRRSHRRHRPARACSTTRCATPTTAWTRCVSYVNDKAANGTAVLNSQRQRRHHHRHAAYTIAAFRVEGGYLSVNDKRPGQPGRQGLLGRRRLPLRPEPGPRPMGGERSEQEQHDLGKTNAYGVGYQFDFSKRTNLYTSLTRFQNDSSSSGAFVGRIGAAMPAGLTTATDRTVNEFVAGRAPRVLRTTTRRPVAAGRVTSTPAPALAAAGFFVPRRSRPRRLPTSCRPRRLACARSRCDANGEPLLRGRERAWRRSRRAGVEAPHRVAGRLPRRAGVSGGDSVRCQTTCQHRAWQAALRRRRPRSPRPRGPSTSSGAGAPQPSRGPSLLAIVRAAQKLVSVASILRSTASCRWRRRTTRAPSALARSNWPERSRLPKSSPRSSLSTSTYCSRS